MTASTEIPHPRLTRRYVELKDWASLGACVRLGVLPVISAA